MVHEGQEVMAPRDHEDYASYHERLQEYLAKVEDLKKSDLANYVAHRRTIIDLLAMAIRRDSQGRYAHRGPYSQSNNAIEEGYGRGRT